MAKQSAEVLKALDLIMEDLTPEQLQNLEQLIKKIPDPSQMSPQDALNLINELKIDVEKLQKKARRQRAEEMEKNRKPRIGANDTCTCGSGKKYKKCCRFQTSS